MQFFFSYFRILKWVGLVCILALVGYFVYKIHNPNTTSVATAKVERGTIENLVSVSGTVKLTNDATLSFAQTGTVAHVFVKEGDVVQEGQVLATLEQQKLMADLHDAEAYIAIQTANRDELIKGPSITERQVSAGDVLDAKNNLTRTTQEQDTQVETTRRTLLSTSLAAVPDDKENTDTPPTISGIYTCTTEDPYTFTTYPSGGTSGYSFTLSGRETGTYPAYTDTAQPFGSCGLFIQFAKGISYGSQKWQIEVPNKRSSAYVTNLNAYELAIEKRKNTIAAAQDAYTKAQLSESQKNSAPRDEAISRANANIAQARARLEALNAERANRSIVAPFTGTISNVHLTTGETSLGGTINLVSQNTSKLSVRIPEIDITKVTLGNTARVHLDARPNETLTAKVGFISPVATEVDGVSYYEALLFFDQAPDWLRGGFNADIDIVTESHNNTLRLPERFVTTVNGAPSVFVQNGNKRESRTIHTGFHGNDGFVEIKDLPEGFEVIAP